MKKFSFSLDNVLNYKQQVLDNLQNEHALILDEIRRQEELIASIQGQYVTCARELTEEEARGITVMQIHTYKNFLDVVAYRIRKEQEVLGVLHKKEEIKRGQVLEARRDSASIEKLREKKVEVYNREVQKQEELLIEEFVMNSRSNRQSEVSV